MKEQLSSRDQKRLMNLEDVINYATLDENIEFILTASPSAPCCCLRQWKRKSRSSIGNAVG